MPPNRKLFQTACSVIPLRTLQPVSSRAKRCDTRTETLFGLCIRGGRGGGTGRRGLLRCGGGAVSGIRGTAGYQRQDNDGEAGNDNFFHSWNSGLDCYQTIDG